MSIEDVLQAKNDNVAGVIAPLIGKYPDGYVDSMKLPMALTWVMSTTLDPTGTIATNTIQIDVFVQSLAQSTFKAIKKSCKELRDLFMTEYTISAANMYVSDDPPIQIQPGSIEFGGYRDIIQAPDESPFHGFSITLEIKEHLNVSCS